MPGTAPPAPTALLSVRDVTVRFGGIVALDGVSFDIEHRADRGPDRSQRRGQDHPLQLPEPGSTPPVGRHSVSPGQFVLGLPRTGSPIWAMGRTFQNLALFPTHDGAAERDGGGAQPDPQRLSHERPALAPGWPARRGKMRQAAGELLEFLDLRAVARHPAAGSPSAPSNASSWRGRWPGAPAVAPGRASRRLEPRGSGRAGPCCCEPFVTSET